MVVDILLFLLGVAIACLTLRDVFDTVIVPGQSRASLRVTPRLLSGLLPLWKHVRGKERGLSGTFAPVVLVSSFVIWMSLLAVGFGFMCYAVRHDFDPSLESIPEALYIAGSSLVTIGLSEETALGISRWIILGAGFCGLAVMTMAVTYLLQVQNSIQKRDIGIIKLNTAAGDPPSAIALLERFAAIDDQHELPEALIEGRNWCATVRQSHAAHPPLIYFQSISAGAGWPAALGALLDLGLLVEHGLATQEVHGPAVLLRDEGTRLAKQLAELAGLKPKPVTNKEAQLHEALTRLRGCGYKLRDKPDFELMEKQRREYHACVKAMADHLGKPTAVLIPKR